MASPARPPVVMRFGEFELNATSGELRKAGLALKIHPQPFRILQLLAERSGQIVSREEIQRTLWGDNTFVDFEGGINFCIKQIRDTIADDADRPKYIETIPRRGYRFIASISRGHPREQVISFPRAAGPVDSSTVSADPAAQTVTSHDLYALPSLARPVPQPGAKKSALRVAIAAVILAALLTAVAFLHFRAAPKLSEKDTIVLADFSNTTGDAVFDDALKQGLAMEVGQSPFLNVLPDDKISETLQMMGRPRNTRLTPEVARELCLRTGSKAVLGGAISTLGSHYLVAVNAVGCSDGENLAREQVEATSQEDVLKALSRAASDLRAKLGESLPSVQKFDVPVEATTTSLEALKYYSMSGKVATEQGDAPAVPLLNRAIELDPNFAMAYAALAAHNSNMNEPSLALQNAEKAYQLRDRVTEREKLRISFIYFRVTGQIEKMDQLSNLWIVEYPRDTRPRGSLGANLLYRGQYEKAIAEFQETLQIGPDVSIYEDLSIAYLALHRLDAAQAMLNQAQASKLDSAGLHWMTYYLAFLQRDSAQMEQQVAWAAGKSGAEDTLLAAASDTEAYFGRLSSARALSRRAVDSAVRAGSRETAALWRANAALREAEVGENADAKKQAREALAMDPGRNVQLFAALALARAGDRDQAQQLASELEKSNPSNTVLLVYRLPAVQAAIALDNGNPAKAVELLEVVKPYELGQPTPLPLATLYPPYIRGQAYLSLHNGAAAAAEFQKVLDHPGIALNFPLGPLANLQIARAYALQGDTPRARAAYQAFLTLWKDADPDIPVLKQAKSEYAKLQ
jgi:eukaryotic-like serine/threonine-protein kinase